MAQGTLPQGTTPPTSEFLDFSSNQATRYEFDAYETPEGKFLVHTAQLAKLSDPFCGAFTTNGRYKRTSDSNRVRWEYGCRNGKRHGTFREFQGPASESEPLLVLEYTDGVVSVRTQRYGANEIRKITFEQPEKGELSPQTIEEFKDGRRIVVIRQSESGHHSIRTVFDDHGIKISDVATVTGQQGDSARFWYPSGTLHAEGQFQSHRMHGEWKIYHTNGRLRATGNFERSDSGASFRQGTWSFYNPDGTLLSQLNFSVDQYTPLEDNIPWFDDSFSRSGFPQFSIGMLGKRKHGPASYWHSNGRLRAQGRYDQAGRIGSWTYSKSSGEVVQTDEESWK